MAEREGIEPTKDVLKTAATTRQASLSMLNDFTETSYSVSNVEGN